MAGTRRKPSSAVKPNASANKRAKTVDLGFVGGDEDDDEIDSEDDFFDRNNTEQGESSSEEAEEETLEAKKVRLAREYLDRLEKKDGSSSSSEEDDDESEEEDDGQELDRVGRKLQKQRWKHEGIYERAVADKLAKSIETIKLEIVDDRIKNRQNAQQQQHRVSTREQSTEWVDHDYLTLLKGHDLSVTCVSLQADGSRAVSGSKDHSVILWDVASGKSIVTLWENWRKRGDKEARTDGQVLSVACSDDGRYAAVGRKDATVSVFDIRQSINKGSNVIKTFTGHKSAITCLCFQTQSSQLFSGSEDRCIRHYNLDDRMYLETLYGHQFGVTGIDCHRKERPISVGRDRTARAWKLQEDTHLIFRGGSKMSPADCVSIIKDDWFLTGHDNGNLSLWMTEKKKAVATIDHAHGLARGSGDIGNGIGSTCALKGSDVACTGSNDGSLRFWKVSGGV
jgi:ribosomal RNA-processing protein 9